MRTDDAEKDSVVEGPIGRLYVRASLCSSSRSCENRDEDAPRSNCADGISLSKVSKDFMRGREN